MSLKSALCISADLARTLVRLHMISVSNSHKLLHFYSLADFFNFSGHRTSVASPSVITYHDHPNHPQQPGPCATVRLCDCACVCKFQTKFR